MGSGANTCIKVDTPRVAAHLRRGTRARSRESRIPSALVGTGYNVADTTVAASRWQNPSGDYSNALILRCLFVLHQHGTAYAYAVTAEQDPSVKIVDHSPHRAA
jgi:hypothetical protein